MARAILDLMGRTFGKLKVIGRTDIKRPDYRITWRCECDCGKLVDVVSIYLTAKETTSCGCAKVNNKLQETLEKDFKVDGVFITKLIQKKRTDNTSGYRGVSKVARKQGGHAYTAALVLKGKRVHFSTHADIKGAIAARKAAEDKYFKPYIDKYEMQTCAAPDCDIKFTPAIHNQEYHIPNCRFRHNKQILRKKRTELGLCPQCGREMDAESNKKHCSKCKEYYKNRRK